MTESCPSKTLRMHWKGSCRADLPSASVECIGTHAYACMYLVPHACMQSCKLITPRERCVRTCYQHLLSCSHPAVTDHFGACPALTEPVVGHHANQWQRH